MTKKRSKLFITAASMLTFSPVIAIVSCAGGNNQTGNNQTGNNDSNQTGKLSLKANEIQLKNVSDQNAMDYFLNFNWELRKLIFKQKEAIFQGDLTNLNAADIFVTPIEANDPKNGIGTLKVLLEVKKINQTLLNPTAVVFKGFNTAVFALKTSEIKAKELISPNEVRSRETVQNFISGKKEELFVNIPNDFDAKKISYDYLIRSDYATIFINYGESRWSLLSGEIKLTDFEKEIPYFKDSTINLTNLDNIEPNTLSEGSIKKLIINKAAEIFDNLSSDELSAEAIWLGNDYYYNGSTLTLDIGINVKDENGYSKIWIPEERITLTGFKTAMQLKPIEEIKLALESGEGYIYDDYKLWEFILSKYEQIFINIPSDFNINDISIPSLYFDDNQNNLIATISVPDLISKTQINLDLIFAPKTPFSKIRPNKSLSLDLLLNDDEKPIYQYNKDLIKQLIFNHAAEIFKNIPANLTSDFIEVEDFEKILSGEGTLKVFIKSPWQDLNLLYLSGFFGFRNSQFELTLTNDENQKDQYLTGTDEAKNKMADLIFKNRSKIFSDYPPDNFTKDWIKIQRIYDQPDSSLKVKLKLSNDGKDIFPVQEIYLKGFAN